MLILENVMQLPLWFVVTNLPDYIVKVLHVGPEDAFNHNVSRPRVYFICTHRFRTRLLCSVEVGHAFVINDTLVSF